MIKRIVVGEEYFYENKICVPIKIIRNKNMFIGTTVIIEFNNDERKSVSAIMFRRSAIKT